MKIPFPTERLILILVVHLSHWLALRDRRYRLLADMASDVFDALTNNADAVYL